MQKGSLVNDKVSQSDKYLVCELQCMLELREHVKTMIHRWSALMCAVYCILNTAIVSLTPTYLTNNRYSIISDCKLAQIEHEVEQSCPSFR